ncbi:hypothetical protein ACPW96_22785 [Micromonospora sp. DT81.3]|uniref:hypothetical protein n=1 Tax=Micromonospora sp. DT81.3 TaxID=3416523 RepID=UPI003CF726F7
MNPAAIAAVASGRHDFADRLEDACTADYLRLFPEANVRSFSYQGAAYLFDERPATDRTILVLAPPTASSAARDGGYQRGYPLPEAPFGRAVDRGHFIAHSAGGVFGPNIFIQDRALNRGWSRDGRAFRALERAAILAGTSALMFVRPIYIDQSAAPAHIELGFWGNGEVRSSVFRNRFDDAAFGDEDRFDATVAGATNEEAAALGEETARVLIESVLGGVLLDSGDSAADRDGHRHGLDLLMLVDGAVVAFEVKTRHVSRDAGVLTRAGNLRRPRLRANLDGLRQGSDEYVAIRADRIIDAGGEYGYPESKVVVVDLVSKLAQLFPVTSHGRVGPPEGAPLPCEAAAREAFQSIMRMRGSLAPPRSQHIGR